MKKLLSILLVFFTLNGYSSQLVEGGFDQCFSQNSILGRHVMFNYVEPNSCATTGTNAIVFWVYFNSVWVQIMPVQLTSNSAILQITDNAMLNYLNNGGTLTVTYNWACWIPGSPYPPNLSLDPVQQNTTLSYWQIANCIDNPCISDFKFCMNTSNMNIPLGNYKVDFIDNDLTNLQNSITNSLNSYLCTNPLNPTTIVVKDSWDYDGDGIPEDVFTNYVGNNSTFQQNQNASHIYTGVNFATVCHSKAIYIGCIIGYLQNGDPKCELSNPLYECKTCLDICLFPPYEPDFITKPIGNEPQIIYPPCLADFNFCSNTDALNNPIDKYTYVFEGEDNSYLINTINLNLINGGLTCLGGQFPFCLVDDYWEFGDGSSNHSSGQYSLPIASNTSISFPSIAHTYTSVNTPFSPPICHKRVISIGCKKSQTSSEIKGVKVIYECSRCIEICINGPHSQIGGQFREKNEGLSTHSSAFDIYPNPASAELFVRGINGHANFTIVDMLGRTMKTIELNNITNEARLNVADLARGSYILKITQEDNTVTTPIVIAD